MICMFWRVKLKKLNWHRRSVRNRLCTVSGSVYRLPGELLVISGRDGRVIRQMTVPDAKESYYSPVIYTKKGGLAVVVFGTGGETHAGALWVIGLVDILAGNMNEVCNKYYEHRDVWSQSTHRYSKLLIQCTCFTHSHAHPHYTLQSFYVSCVDVILTVCSLPGKLRFPPVENPLTIIVKPFWLPEQRESYIGRMLSTGENAFSTRRPGKPVPEISVSTPNLVEIG